MDQESSSSLSVENGADDDVIAMINVLESVNPNEYPEAKQSILQYLNDSKDKVCLNALVMSYLSTTSQRALDVLVGVREPHDLYLFDSFVDYLKDPKLRSQLLSLISQIINKKPAWLAKVISNHKILQEFILIIKTDQDILTLVKSICILIDLISTLPSIIGSCLTEIFDSFSRLCFYLNKQTLDNSTDYNITNLHIWVYRLFHKLYGMYPCNFLDHLRQTYGTPRTTFENNIDNENVEIFNKIIQPFLHTVRLHPLLVSSSKDTEILANRWKKMEPHDIIAECSKFVLDPLEGNQGECDFISDFHASLSSANSTSKHTITTNDSIQEQQCQSETQTLNETSMPTSVNSGSKHSSDQESLIWSLNQELQASSNIYSIESILQDKTIENQENDIQETNNQCKSPIHHSDNQLTLLYNILDKHLSLGSELCLKEMNYPLAAAKETDWTHFGDPAPPDEINILKSQMALLHAQLLFERQQRENHALRNRALIKKAKKNYSKEEEFIALKDQLKLQEDEIQSCKDEIKHWREKCKEIEQKSKQENQLYQIKIVEYDAKLNKFHVENKNLTDDIATIKQKFAHLHNDYQDIQAKNIQLEEESNNANMKINRMKETIKENDHLKRQVLLLTELYNNVRDQMVNLKKNLVADEINDMQIKTMRNEMKELKTKFDFANHQLDTFKTKSFELENQLLKKDGLISDFNATKEQINSTHQAQLSAEKQRVNALLKICERLEQQILTHDNGF